MSHSYSNITNFAAWSVNSVKFETGKPKYFSSWLNCSIFCVICYLSCFISSIIDLFVFIS